MHIPDDLSHVLMMVLNDNKGMCLTEALIIGIDASVHHYLNALPEKVTAQEINNG